MLSGCRHTSKAIMNPHSILPGYGFYLAPTHSANNTLEKNKTKFCCNILVENYNFKITWIVKSCNVRNYGTHIKLPAFVEDTCFLHNIWHQYKCKRSGPRMKFWKDIQWKLDEEHTWHIWRYSYSLWSTTATLFFLKKTKVWSSAPRPENITCKSCQINLATFSCWDRSIEINRQDLKTCQAKHGR